MFRVCSDPVKYDQLHSGEPAKTHSLTEHKLRYEFTSNRTRRLVILQIV